MPGWLKFVLLMLAAGVLGLALFVGAIAWWVNKNKDSLIEGARAAQAGGRNFGRTHSKGECIDDSLTRLKLCKSIDLICATGVRVRLTTCMSVAKDDGACQGVPGPMELLKLSFWESRECARRGQPGSQSCQSLMQGVAEACAQGQP
jgi:hypothetical protein